MAIIPNDYLRCDFLQTTGHGSKIDTGVAGNDLTLEFSGDVEVMTFKQYGFIFNTPQRENGQSANLKTWRLILPSTKTGTWLAFGTYKHYSTTVTTSEWTILPKRFQFYISYGYVELTIDGTTSNATTSTDDGYANNTNTIVLGAPYANEGTADAFQTRIYSFSIKSNGELIRDYYPVVRKSDNLAGFYDAVNDTFNPSVGPVQFIPGFQSYEMLQVRRRMIEHMMFLPPKYEQRNYIQTVGTASFFDTGIAGNDETIKIDFVVLPLARGNYAGGVLGNHDDEQKKCWRVIQGATANNNRWTVTLNNRRAGSSSSLTVTHLDTILSHVFYMHLEYGYATVQQAGNSTVYSVSPAADTNETSDKNIYIGANGPNKSQSTTSASHRFYNYIKIYKQGRLVRYYVPCVRKSDSKAGFYDMVNHTFNYSIGNAQFIASTT